MNPSVVIIRLGRVVHPSTVEVPELRCHAGADHGNARDRGAAGILCGPCWAAVVTLLRRFTVGAGSPARDSMPTR